MDKNVTEVLNCLINHFLSFYYKVFFAYIKMPKISSVKYYQDNKEKQSKNAHER